MSTHDKPTGQPDCVLCREDGGIVLWRNEQLRVIDAADPLYPGFTRVIWNAHAAEMTDLDPADRQTLMQAVYIVEQVQRDTLRPHKVNLAALGNIVPHVHWHVIPRWCDDTHFPDAVWAAPRREPARASANAPDEALLTRYQAALRQALDGEMGVAEH